MKHCIILLFIHFISCNNSPTSKVTDLHNPSFLSNRNEIKQRIIEESKYLNDSIIIKTANNFEDFMPNQYWAIAETAYGDLDGIKGNEAAVVYRISRDRSYQEGYYRLAIFKRENQKWILWRQTTSPLLEAWEGGSYDPFDGIRIEKRAIVINHFGGSGSGKWTYTHRYRFQNNNWYLIGASTSNFTYDYDDSLDYNLSTGIALYKRTTEYYMNDEDIVHERNTWTKRIKLKRELPLMDEFAFCNRDLCDNDRRVKVNEYISIYY